MNRPISAAQQHILHISGPFLAPFHQKARNLGLYSSHTGLQ
jgi:hypothetical protein